MFSEIGKVRWENLEPGLYEQGMPDFRANAIAPTQSKGPSKGPSIRALHSGPGPEKSKEAGFYALGSPQVKKKGDDDQLKLAARDFSASIDSISVPGDKNGSDKIAYTLAGSMEELDADMEPEMLLSAEAAEAGPDPEQLFDSMMAEICASSEQEEIHARKPKDIILLEQILTEALSPQAAGSRHSPVSITRVRDLQRSRKDKVKEVFYEIGDGGLYRVWVFQAGLKDTIRELNTYYIAAQAGVPTGIPIGYKPQQCGGSIDSEIAIVGGILNHVGQSYTQLLVNLQMRPDLLASTAETVAALIAEYQIKLTAAKDEFERLGVGLKRFDIRKEMEERFLAGLGISKHKHGRHIESLLSSLEFLSETPGSPRVVSHNDTHTNNFLTAEHTSATGQIGNSYQRFGVIDWGDVAVDHPYGDLMDFYVHLRRVTDSLPGKPNIRLSSIADAHKRRFDELGGQYGLFLDPKAQGHAPLVKDLVWNMLEMYDPKRKDRQDIVAKARRHFAFVLRDLDALGRVGAYHKQLGSFRSALEHVLRKETYLRN